MNGEGKKFYECDPLLWDDINNVGLRNVYICSVYAARLMVPKNRGLIVNISSAGGLQYFFNVAYGVGKTAVGKLTLHSPDLSSINSFHYLYAFRVRFLRNSTRPPIMRMIENAYAYNYWSFRQF